MTNLLKQFFLSTSDKLISDVNKQIDKLITHQTRKDIIKKSLTSRGLFIKANTIKSIVEIADNIAPEHLEIFGYDRYKVRG